MNLYVYLSLILFFISIYFFQKTKSNKILKLLYSMFYFIYIIFLDIYIGSYYFTSEGITNSVIYHFNYGLAGAGFKEYWEITAILISIIVISIIFWLFMNKQKENRFSKNYLSLAFLFIFISLSVNPFTMNLYNLYVKADTGSQEQFNKYYNEPNLTKIDEDKNLVFIYAESLERTYFDNEIFPGLMSELKKIEGESTYFTDIRKVGETGYTIGGLVASQTGIPLYTPSLGNSREEVNLFLPAAKTVGALLKSQDYYLTFYGGAELNFAGKGKFYKTDSFDEVYNVINLSKKNKENQLGTNSRGLYDKDLLDSAFDKYRGLSENEDKFALFLLTMGTHQPNGYYKTDIKYKDGSNKMLNYVASSDYLISRFIKDILESPYKNETIIVLVSYHLAMRNDVSHLLNKGERRNTFIIIDPSKLEKTEVNRKGSILDVAPTILPFIGYKGEIGLGRNLLSKDYDEDEISKIHSNLNNWKAEILDFWDFPVIDNHINILLEEKKLIIDDREYEVPILVEIDENYKTMIRYDSHYNGQNFEDYIRKNIVQNKKYLYIDRASEANKIDPSLSGNELALILGKGDKIIDSQKIDGDIKLDKEKLITLYNSKYFSKKINLWRRENSDYSLKDTIRAIKNGDLVIISVKDEASSNLPKEYIKQLSNYESNIDNLGFRDAYLAIFYKDKLINEKFSDGQLIELNDKIKDYELKLKSSGWGNENISSIKINGNEFSENKRGLNIVVVNDLENNILSTMNFDTYSGDYNSGF